MQEQYDCAAELAAFGLRLKQAREAKGLNQIEFADLAGAKKTAYVGYEGGKTGPSIAFLYRLEEHGIDIGWLLTGRSLDEPGLSEQEVKLLQLFGKLSSRERKAVIALIRGLAGLEETSLAAIIERKAAGLD